MKTFKHLKARGALVVGVLLAVTCLAPCAEKKQTAEEQRAEKIEARIEKTLRDWWSKPELTRPAYDDVVRQIFDSLSEEDTRLVARHVHALDVEQEAFRRWARFDPAGALKAVRAIEDSHAAEIRLAGTGLEGGPGEAISDLVSGMYLGALDGWSEVAPKAAWESFKRREGPLSKSLVVEDYLFSFHQVFIDHLARVDPDLAFQEIMQFRADDSEEILIASMLAGYLHAAPRGRDWSKEASRLLERKWERDHVHAEIRTALMGRWLQDAPKAAEKWFCEGDVEGLHWSYAESPQDVLDPFAADEEPSQQQQAPKTKRRHDLGNAAGYWAARDFPAAWRWMKSYREFRREGFEQAVLHGADVSLSNGTSYFWGGERASTYILEQASRLPDQEDRTKLALRFANVLWRFDDPEILGEPPPDRAKWLDHVRRSMVALRLNDEATTAVIEKLGR